MTEAVWVALIVNTSGLIGLIIKMARDGRAKRAGNNPHPCAKNGERIAKLEEAVETLKEDIREIKAKI